MAVLSIKLQILNDRFKEQPEITVSYFKPDDKKAGGAYLQKTAYLKRIDDVERLLHFTDGSNLPIDDITDLQGEIFRVMESVEYES